MLRSLLQRRVLRRSDFQIVESTDVVLLAVINPVDGAFADRCLLLALALPAAGGNHLLTGLVVCLAVAVARGVRHVCL